MGGGISFCFALMDGLTRMGGAVVGLPRHDGVYGENVYEVRRMVCLDETPKNVESYFLGKIIWWLKKHTNCESVLSYSDSTAGHKGTIYKAANFKLVGETNPSKNVEWKGKTFHIRSMSPDKINPEHKAFRQYAVEMKKAVESGEAKIVDGLPKKIWIYKISRN